MDFIIASKMGMIGIQRKTIDDFLASVRDGRLASQLSRSVEIKIRYMVIEGELLLTRDGYVLTNWSQNITVSQFNKMLLSVGLEGYQIWRTEDIEDTVRFVETVDDWGKKKRHSTVTARGTADKDPWGETSGDKEAVHFLQGLPSIGYTTAKNLYDRWGIPLVWSIGEGELIEVPGIGKHRAKRLIEFIGDDL